MNHEMDQTQAGAYQITLTNKEVLRLAQNRWNGLDLLDWHPFRYELGTPPLVLANWYPRFCHAFRHAHPSRLRIHRWENTVELELVVPLDLGVEIYCSFTMTLYPQQGMLSLTCFSNERNRDDSALSQTSSIPHKVKFYLPLADAVHFGLVTRCDA